MGLVTDYIDTAMKARIRGVQAMMTSFDFFFGCSLRERLLKQTDNLSSALAKATPIIISQHQENTTDKFTLMQ